MVKILCILCILLCRRGLVVFFEISSSAVGKALHLTVRSHAQFRTVHRLLIRLAVYRHA